MIQDFIAKVFGESAVEHVTDGVSSVIIIILVVFILWMFYRAFMGSRRKK